MCLTFVVFRFRSSFLLFVAFTCAAYHFYIMKLINSCRQPNNTASNGNDGSGLVGWVQVIDVFHIPKSKRFINKSKRFVSLLYTLSVLLRFGLNKSYDLFAVVDVYHVRCRFYCMGRSTHSISHSYCNIYAMFFFREIHICIDPIPFHRALVNGCLSPHLISIGYHCCVCVCVLLCES